MLSFTAATRMSDYDTFGDTTNSKVAMLLSPMDGLNFRASFAEGFRAPSIGALYSGNADSFPTLHVMLGSCLHFQNKVHQYLEL